MADDSPLAFDHLDLFSRMAGDATTQEFQHGQAIFSQGEKADAIFFIQNGNVKLTVKSDDGKKAVIAILRQGDFFGEGCVTQKSRRSCTAIAIEPSTISRVSRMALVRALHDEPAFSKLFISYLLYRIGRFQEEFVDQIFSPSEKRLARILLRMAGIGTNSNPVPVALRVNQETLAEMVGTTRSRISFFMNRFRKMGFIDYNGTVQVHGTLSTFLSHSNGEK